MQLKGYCKILMLRPIEEERVMLLFLPRDNFPIISFGLLLFTPWLSPQLSKVAFLELAGVPLIHQETAEFLDSSALASWAAFKFRYKL